ncbi:hypothetical protein F2Q69_00020929 [Brassica cretica]|uniref:Uncharacterized protein n=1 Tax=Brassica cretica TaxID=69181 RepID=A0A8S9Q4B0_BRACR|nr:hypothetical protein F2Q69_00020929 [Brassica cretica]
MMGKVNQERLAEYLGELKQKQDTNDRYMAALKGETLTRKPYQRIQPAPKPNDTRHLVNQAGDSKMEKDSMCKCFVICKGTDHV